MRLVSWNINSLRKRQERLVGWLRESGPDIVCLQETKCTDDQFPEQALRNAGYHSAFHGQKSYNGVAILARSELGGVRNSLGDEVADEHARVIAATFGDIRVVCIYAPNGQAIGAPAYEYKLQWYARLNRYLTEQLKAFPRLIVCGDFNIAPENRDVYEPALWRGAIMCSEQERSAFDALCAMGFADTLRLHHPEEGLFSWWDYRMLSFPKNRGLRIDAILASKPVAARCTDGGIEREMRKGKEPSDHAPVWAEFGKEPAA
jgi:exodeoxyribonuclease-3